MQQKTASGDRNVETALTLRSAVAFHQAGRLVEAEALYRQILQVDSGHSDALQLLGMIACQTGNYEKAIELIGQAIATDPKKPAYHYNQGIAYRLLNNLDAAVGCYRRALALQPDYVDAYYNLGNALQMLGNLDAAAENFNQALLLKPDYVEVYNNLGNICTAQGRVEEGIANYRKAITLKPDYAEVYCNLGNALMAQGNAGKASANYRKSILCKPDFAEAHKNLGNALYFLGRLEEAEASYRRALEFRPEDAETHDSLGCILHRLGRFDEAEASHRRALRIKPDFARAQNNLGYTLETLGRLDEALESYRLSLAAGTDWQAALNHLTTPLILPTGLVLDSPNVTLQPVAAGGDPPLPAPARSKSRQRKANSAGGVSTKRRIMLIYPPPWQISAPGETLSEMPFGPPREGLDSDLNEDFQVMTYGLLTIAAQARRAGYEVSLHNLSTSPWSEVVTLLAGSEADLYGISAFTANRRGLGAIAALIRGHHPQAHIVAGGPFVTALPLETLQHYREIDTAVIGEGETTFMEIIEALESGRPVVGIPGTAWRNGKELTIGPTRPRIDNLDRLASPFDYFTSDIVMTSRGCPSKCTFCGSFTTWGKKLRFQSVDSCLDTFKRALDRLPVPFLMIKDDTFTADRRRTLTICDAIITNRMNFLWSCDTRVDCLDDELLCKMRQAGCQTISFGVESGSPEILKSIRKETTPEMILEATRSAQKYGMNVRYYMMLLNRGETLATIHQSNELIKAGRPERFFFSSLSFFPGTEDWAILCKEQGITSEIFFANDFKELSVVINRRQEYQNLWLHGLCEIGTIQGFSYTVEEREAIVLRLPMVHSVHVELANAYFRAGRLAEAAAALDRAEVLCFPIANIITNQRACIALAQGNVEQASMLLEQALQTYPHPLVANNLSILQSWVNTPTSGQGQPQLNDSILAMDFQSIIKR